MQRILIAIGCDDYDHLDRLNGAESDATRVYHRLLKQDIGNYDTIHSKLLLSPSLAELHETIERALFQSGKIDTLTLFFAGHGEVRPTGFYFCVRDTQAARMSVSALPLTDLFLQIAEAQPAQTNIIIDACYSGGLVADLSVLAKPDIMGDAGTPSITLLAMSARNQSSWEGDEGGFGTSALLDCVNGVSFIQDSTSALDLSEIGKKVSERISEKIDQDPVVWDLNVRKRSIFCRNPHYQTTVQAAFEKWEPRTFIDALEPLLSSHVSSPREQIEDVERLSSGLNERAQLSRDVFLPIIVRATSIVSLLQYCEGVDDRIDNFIGSSSIELATRVEQAIQFASERIRTDKFALLSPRGGLADLFYLPLRISKLLGWAGAAYQIKRTFGLERHFDKDELQQFLRLLIEHYSTSIVSLSDNQAPDIACILAATKELGLLEEGEVLASLFFNTAASANGNLADTHIDKDKVLSYLIARGSKRFGQAHVLLARPSELITVLIKSAALFSLEEAFNDGMASFDHLTINEPVPEILTGR